MSAQIKAMSRTWIELQQLRIDIEGQRPKGYEPYDRHSYIAFTHVAKRLETLFRDSGYIADANESKRLQRAAMEKATALDTLSSHLKDRETEELTVVSEPDRNGYVTTVEQHIDQRLVGSEYDPRYWLWVSTDDNVQLYESKYKNVVDGLIPYPLRKIWTIQEGGK